MPLDLGSGGTSSGSGDSDSGPPPLTLPAVMRFLQTEWRRFDRERNEWSIERAEYKSHITVLEGERRGIEASKADLVRRVKMLEFALRQER
jgi:striatin 1/3/4